MSDKTVIKPRPGARAGKVPPAPAAKDNDSHANDKTQLAVPNEQYGAQHKPTQLSVSDNVLIDDAGTLISLISPIRSTRQHQDALGLKKQCVLLIQQYEQQLRAKQIGSELIERARYCMCCFIDEVVLNTNWGGNSDWATESLLSTFHNETFGGEYFFTLLESAILAPRDNLMLLELQYLCLSLGFVGKMRVEDHGYEKLETIKDRAYKAIRSQRGEPSRELSPGWRSDVKEVNRLESRFPLWVLCSFIGVVLLGAYMYFNYQINLQSDQINRELNALVVAEEALPAQSQIGHDGLRLQQLLQTEVGMGLLQVMELPDRVRIRVGLQHLFTPGGSEINESFLPVVVKIARALEGTEGRILVNGYTDDLPIFTSRYPSNWHLSLARANVMAESLAAGANLHGRLQPEGRGEADPIVPNDSPANRALNRRVEIDLLK
ncbi:type VI secretion system protein TssL, long form [Shewanella sp. AS16]|uniref:type VI secretion system protein TssL, long form n=1 Tax=Shewanella sp. AS16 TaxID=2907625 RepID=UPI001F2AFE38|nr:type VI secretion system protein TssL, long form [Shewanella sp. AS16]MCE9687193.1 type VI secretion system protein TssL, long form [Shewanella sp. AS16]